MQVSIIIVNYNANDHLVNCLGSIIKFTKDVDYEIVVVDNNSPFRDIVNLPQEYPTIKYFFRNVNDGFGSGCNYGAGQAQGKFFAFVNPDIIFTSNIIYPIFRNMDENIESGACAPMLTYEDRKYQNSTGFRMGFLYEFFEAFWLMGFYRKLKRIKYVMKNRIPLPVKVGWVSGALMVVRRDVFEKLNGFDEDFFLNYEDIDLCRRIEKSGFKNFYFPHLKCIHVGLASQSKNYTLLIINRYMSRLIYARKHYKLLLRIVVRLIHIVGLSLRIVIYYFKQKNIENKQRFSGYKKSFMIYLSNNNKRSVNN